MQIVLGGGEEEEANEEEATSLQQVMRELHCRGSPCNLPAVESLPRYLHPKTSSFSAFDAVTLTVTLSGPLYLRLISDDLRPQVLQGTNPAALAHFERFAQENFLEEGLLFWQVGM